jgi:hypothetical protein
VAVGEEEGDELQVLIHRPRPLLHARLVTARLPPHHYSPSPNDQEATGEVQQQQMGEGAPGPATGLCSG